MKKYFYMLFLIFLMACSSNTINKTVHKECSHLNKQEKVFANNLSDLHRNIFCQKFTRSQRAHAMDLLKTQQEKPTPDEAVEKVLRANRNANCPTCPYMKKD